jgi:hypothetical protein
VLSAAAFTSSAVPVLVFWLTPVKEFVLVG